MPKPTLTIAEIRFFNGRMTQQEFADSIGVTPQTVSSWERDITKISARHLMKICDKYGVKSSELLGA